MYEYLPEHLHEYLSQGGPKNEKFEQELDHWDAVDFARRLVRRWMPVLEIEYVAALDYAVTEFDDKSVSELLGKLVVQANDSRIAFEELNGLFALRSERNDSIPEPLRLFMADVARGLRKRPSRPGSDPLKNTQRDNIYAMLVRATKHATGLAAYSGGETMNKPTVIEAVIEALRLEGHHASFEQVKKAYIKSPLKD